MRLEMRKHKKTAKMTKEKKEMEKKEMMMMHSLEMMMMHSLEMMQIKEEWTAQRARKILEWQNPTLLELKEVASVVSRHLE